MRVCPHSGHCRQKYICKDKLKNYSNNMYSLANELWSTHNNWNQNLWIMTSLTKKIWSLRNQTRSHKRKHTRTRHEREVWSDKYRSRSSQRFQWGSRQPRWQPASERRSRAGRQPRSPPPPELSRVATINAGTAQSHNRITFVIIIFILYDKTCHKKHKLGNVPK